MADSRPWPLAVTTRAGTVQGTEDQHGTLAWRGIPFGLAPVGDLRWRAPRDPAPWTDSRPASSFGPAPWSPGTNGSSEDCLYLNIWRPADAVGGLPVYVWLPGGANQQQVPAVSETPGALLASRSEVVFVTVSYRVGEMGWLSHPALRQDADPLDASGNYGTLDIIKALRWVRDNIDAFGGDPGNVLLTGESAGAFNTLTLLTSPMAGGLFHKAMAQSGRTDSHPVELADQRGQGVLERLLTDEHGGQAAGARALRAMSLSDIAAFLRSRTPEQVAVAARGLSVAGFNDGVVLHARGFSSLEDGSYPNKVPAIVGMNQEEAKLFLLRSNPRLQEDRPLWEAVSSVASAQKRATCCDLVLRNLAANADQPPVYGYLFRWGWSGDHPNPLPEPLSWSLGACHGMDIPFFLHGGQLPLFGTNVFTAANRPGRIALADAMMGYLRNFAHTGKPGTPSADLPVWEPWSNAAGGPKHIVFDADLDRRLVEMGTEELTVDAVRVRFDALAPAAREIAAGAERSFALASRA
jgi:para-nitrobenzyl esterase